MSIDSFKQFINYLKSKLNIDEINNILKEKNLNNYFTKNYKIYFKKEKLYTKKDYLLKQKKLKK